MKAENANDQKTEMQQLMEKVNNIEEFTSYLVLDNDKKDIRVFLVFIVAVLVAIAVILFIK